MWTYAKAGVDLSKHRSMHKYALNMVEELSKHLLITLERGKFVTWLRDLNLTLHVDGVGTKTLVAKIYGSYDVLGWDCIAMNVNDVVCDGGIPIAVVDYIAMDKADEKAFTGIMNGLYKAAKTSNVVILGGETAIMPDLINGIDVVCAMLAIKRHEFKNNVREGDIVVGFASNGVHANGFSLIRKVIESTIGYHAKVDDINLKDELLKPTAIYSKLVLELIERNLISSATHITGGAFTKLKRVLSKDLDIIIKMPKPPRIFELIMKLGNIPVNEMYKVFNMGIGFIVTTSKNNVDKIIGLAQKHNHKPYVLGEVVSGSNKVIIHTPWGEVVEL